MKNLHFTPLQIVVHIAGWFPLGQIAYFYVTDKLTANPIQRIEQLTGVAALTFLLLSLACTPVAAISGWKKLTQRRKALGNYGFMYAAMHVSTFIAVDYGFDLNAILLDVGTKQYIIIGATAFLLLLPLAITSFKYWMKRLGKNWKRLHRLVYIITPLVILHFALVVKGNITSLQGNLARPLIYGSVAAILLLLRILPIKNGLIQLRTRIAGAIANRNHARLKRPEVVQDKVESSNI
jgi:sulfoxide reductase heme-binding subunit YedZ